MNVMRIVDKLTQNEVSIAATTLSLLLALNARQRLQSSIAKTGQFDPYYDPKQEYDRIDHNPISFSPMGYS